MYPKTASAVTSVNFQSIAHFRMYFCVFTSTVRGVRQRVVLNPTVLNPQYTTPNSLYKPHTLYNHILFDEILFIFNFKKTRSVSSHTGE